MAMAPSHTNQTDMPMSNLGPASKQQEQSHVMSTPGSYHDTPIWTDWILFGVGWICGIAWIIGAFLPLCRRPRFPASRNKQGWVFNICGCVLLLVIVVIAIIRVSIGNSTGRNYYN